MQTSEPEENASVRTLARGWDASEPILLDGWLERRGGGISPVWTIFAALIGAFVLFHVLGVVVTVMLLVGQGVSLEQLAADLEGVVGRHIVSVLEANAIAQALGLALPACLLARMHTHKPAGFLRLSRIHVADIVLAVVAIAAFTPVVQWLGAVNGHIPLPDALRRFEDPQMELIRRVLEADTGIVFNLAVLAVTPALCEEVLFRGYVQRQAERKMGVPGGILFSGIVFGLYHLRFSQALPLCALGILMAYLTWRTGSLWPAVAVHFANNALAVALGTWFARPPEHDMAALEQMNMPWYLVLSGAFLFLVVILCIERMVARRSGKNETRVCVANHSGSNA